MAVTERLIDVQLPATGRTAIKQSQLADKTGCGPVECNPERPNQTSIDLKRTIKGGLFCVGVAVRLFRWGGFISFGLFHRFGVGFFLTARCFGLFFRFLSAPGAVFLTASPTAGAHGAVMTTSTAAGCATRHKHDTAAYQPGYAQSGKNFLQLFGIHFNFSMKRPLTSFYLRNRIHSPWSHFTLPKRP